MLYRYQENDVLDLIRYEEYSSYYIEEYKYSDDNDIMYKKYWNIGRLSASFAYYKWSVYSKGWVLDNFTCEDVYETL